MNDREFSAIDSAPANTKKFKKLVSWLEENSSTLKRERSIPVPQALELLQFARNLERVTTREFEVFEQVIEGLTAVQIGERLKISPRTVDVHKSRFIQKMEIGNMVVAARYFSILETLLVTQEEEKNANKVPYAS